MENGKYIKIVTVVLCLLQLIVLSASCSNGGKSEQQILSGYDGFIIKYDNYIYYYDMPESFEVTLSRYDISTKESAAIDTLSCKTDTNALIEGVVSMSCIDGRLYYGKRVDDKNCIYSIDIINPETPIFEGVIPCFLDYHYGEGRNYSSEFKMFKADALYVFAKSKLYKLTPESTNEIADNLSALYIDDSNVYYSIAENSESLNDNIQTGSIYCLNTRSGKNQEIVSGDDIKNFNETKTVYGDTVEVKNIIKYKSDIYFCSVYEQAPILRYSCVGDSEIKNITDTERVLSFRIYDDQIYYINSKNMLCSLNLETSSEKVIAKNIYAFNIYHDTIFYYKMNSDSGAKQLFEYNPITNDEVSLCKEPS